MKYSLDSVKPVLHVNSAEELKAHTVCSSCEVRKVELDLIPTIIKTHRHSTNERLHSRG